MFIYTSAYSWNVLYFYKFLLFIELPRNVCYYKQMLYHSKVRQKEKAKKRLVTRYGLPAHPTHEDRIRQLLLIEPSWELTLRECLTISKKRSDDGTFAGAWVMQSLRAQGVTPPNNLRTLTSIGILKLGKTTRGGNRAYYVIQDRKNLAKVLKNFLR